ncbi:ABC transporter permease subunit [Listeria booriae]|uniref:ABC transporter permease subunit n=1 Tax=Listeria booriae TaxID=1552123 RepID=A0A7X1DFS7_9LIST|nr:ABC transporter permease subunit [Listeria booriae]MBC1493408.1 ABC transporter permease subunit [Listeria booriae]MBC1504163.1 ABC transporter permease subunit [Listeria booriae]MBC1523617.1 ABC transporter permease subunit [Listeria booriae]MBC1531225.1 ABC transporter permease subunit [Listeria booriae]MBC2284601.1 ABC transporter permease subunit [Listeria booriae]
MMALIANETRKISLRFSTWLYPIIIMVVILALATIFRSASPDIDNVQFMLSINGISMFLVALFSIVVASSVVASEFSFGTIKLLLVRPYKRWEILLSKYIVVMLYAVALALFTLLITYLISGLLTSFGSLTQDVSGIIPTYSENGDILNAGLTAINALSTQLGFFLVELIFSMSIAFMVSSLLRSQALAVGIGLFLLFINSIAGGITLMLAEKFEWFKYIFVTPLYYINMNSNGMGNTEIDSGLSTGLAIGILAVYYIVFMALSFVFFQKRDVSV